MCIRSAKWVWFFLIGCILASCVPGTSKALGDQVKLLTLHGEVTLSSAAYICSEIDSANRNQYGGIFIEMDTLGGMAQAADDIARAVEASSVPVTVYVTGKAHGAGTLVALAAHRLYMAPFSSIGEAKTLPDTQPVRAAWIAMLHAVATRNDRSAELAVSMAADGRIFTAYEAGEAGFTQGIADDIPQALLLAGLGGLHNVIVPPDLLTVFAGIISNPTLSTVLFVVGVCLLLFEIFGVHLGLPGLLGLCCLALYYGGGLLAGYARWWAVALFGISALLLFIESVTPGFGAYGAAALVAMVASIYFGSRSLNHFLMTMGIATVATVVTIPFALRRFFADDENAKKALAQLKT